MGGGDQAAEQYREWTLTGLGPDLKGYPEEAFEVAPSLRWQAVRTTAYEPSDAPVSLPLDLSEGAFTILAFGVNQTGSIGLEVSCEGPTRLYVLFDEILTEGDVDPRRLRCLNILDCAVEPGAHAFETFEPYTLRYLKLAVLEGACRVERVALRTFANPEAAEASFASGDPDLDLLFEAGRETLRQNALDLLMDCPSRERAGWPCDSFFTARAAALLTGSTAVERAFLENYARAPQMSSLPEGMLPMNYPADHPNGDFLGVRTAQFIPNWPLWLVLQLEEYLERSGDRDMVEAFEEKVRALFAYFARVRNEDGLLEDLEGWVFVEWSKANEFVAGVNYPTNMLYAATLDAAARLYGERHWREEASRLRETIAREAFDGWFFVDQALRQGADLVRTEHRTETCQYYAFYYGVASPETDGDLWETLRTAFGPGRDPEVTHPEVHPAAMLNGYYLRLELLERYGYGREVVEEALAYFLPMARATGTLWEHHGPLASCCHGFASHVAVTLCRHVFGLDRVDAVGRAVYLREGLPGVTGTLRLPLGEGTLSLRREGAEPPALTLPEGYRAAAPPLAEGVRQ
jgi:alpha-L-rhamnosidase